MFYLVGIILIFVIIDLAFGKIVISGQKNIPKNDGFIVASSHVSYFDPVAIGYALWIKSQSRVAINYLAKAQLGRSAFFRWFLKQYNVYFVKRGKANRETLEKALDLLKSGKSILIFPEGSTKPEHKKVSSGVGFLAIKSGRPVLPASVEISGYYRAVGFWPLSVMIIKWFFGPGQIKVKFGPVIKYQANSDRQQITNMVMEKINSL